MSPSQKPSHAPSSVGSPQAAVMRVARARPVPPEMSGTATALIVTVLAEIYGAVPEESALTAVLSNALSMFTLTGFVWLFMRLGMI